ncbi:hypothetical protein [Acinetobacter baumannii]|nr:hypothetical protein [Acinetobacter baumannii]EKP63169.1 hypothetical protein ACINNAV82_1959 [Acinetobacter baumannii Naval-82]ENV25667.1 hypothetical protein F962_01951 [Acinetobacter baumannii NIPH 190]EXE18758.1 putative lipoprotein [Acinetobacter baumannii 1106579]
MNKTILGLMVVPLVLSGCIKKAEEKPTEKTGFVAQRFEMQSAPN